jgi:hypothetical protein
VLVLRRQEGIPVARSGGFGSTFATSPSERWGGEDPNPLYSGAPLGGHGSNSGPIRSNSVQSNGSNSSIIRSNSVQSNGSNSGGRPVVSSVRSSAAPVGAGLAENGGNDKRKSFSPPHPLVTVMEEFPPAYEGLALDDALDDIGHLH